MNNRRKTLNDLAEGAQLDAVARLRSGRKEFHPEPPKHANPALLGSLISHEETQGWTLDRRYKTRARMFRVKPADVQLEDDVWSLFYRLKFDRISSDRNLYVSDVGEKGERQIDIVARDDSAIYFVECTQQDKEGPRSVTNLIQRFDYLTPKIRRAVQTAFADGRKLEIKYLIATKGITWTAPDILRAKEVGISQLTEDDIRYFVELTGLLRDAARYQFHARYLSARRNESLKRAVFASKVKVGERTAYHFMASPYDILKVASVSHRARTSENDLKSYQRMVSTRRLEDIGQFIKEENSFPTNIVCNFKVKKKQLVFNPIDSYGNVQYGELHIPPIYGSLMVIDGQHRLYGYAYAETEYKDDKAAVSILAYENLSIDEEIRIFVDINTKQKKVRTSLANEIKASIGLDQEDARDQITAIATRVVQLLDTAPESPLKGRIQSERDGKSKDRYITLSNGNDGLEKHGFVGTAQKSKNGYDYEAGFLTAPGGDAGETVAKATAFMVAVLRFVAESAPTNWAKGNAPEGFWCSNIGYRTLCHLLDEVMTYLSDSKGVGFSNLAADVCAKRVEPFVREAARYIERSASARVSTFRGRGGRGGIQKNAVALEMHLHESTSLGYDPDDIVKRKLRKNQASHDEWKGKLDGAASKLRMVVKIGLDENYPDEENDWWFKGVPPTVQTRCQQLVTKSQGKSQVWDHVDTTGLIEIMEMGGNWRSFKNLLAGSPYKGIKKDELVDVFRKAVDVRNELNDEDSVLAADDEKVAADFAGIVSAMASELKLNDNVEEAEGPYGRMAGE